MPFSSAAARIAAVLLFCARALAASNPAPAANSDPIYQQLRGLALGAEAVTVTDLTLKRDAATFHFRSGTVCFVPPVQGKVTGAVFVGDGLMVLDPPTAVERRSLSLLTKGSEFSETFQQLVLRFTDSTYNEIKNSGTPPAANCDPNLLRDSQNALRHDHFMKFNLDARILQDLLGTQPGGLFVAFVHGKKYDDKEVYAVDPHGAPPLLFPVAPEEVEFITYRDSKLGVWAAFHLADEYKKGIASSAENNSVVRIERQQLDTTIEKNANLTGKSITTFVSQGDGVRVVPFSLFPKLRVQSVTGKDGQNLAYIQEGKDDDAEFFSVILPAGLAKGDKYAIAVTYSGKDAVSNEGNGNYYPIARENWYPSSANQAFGSYSDYELTFRIPKGMKMAATGTLVSESNQGNENVTTWKSEVPQTLAGFNFGKFKMEEAKLTKPEFTVQSFANEDPPSWAAALQHASENSDALQGTLDGRTLGTMDTTRMLKQTLGLGELAVQLYSAYFGAIPTKRVALTQQTACNYGQSWPTLVWLPICSFYDSTVRHGLGIDWGDRGYWKIVTPHEIAHQWWGQNVGFNSYRDQWMSEGFADMSASLFIQLGEKNPKKFIEFWNDERDFLTEKNKDGFRAIDTGPLTLGYRLDNSRVGFNVSRQLIYPKGAFVLHMIRMMMWDRQTGDENFKSLMQDFNKTYSGRSATTEDFKAVLERHMTPEMANLGGNMSWFFDQYVYGTALPNYNLQYSLDPDADGNTVLGIKLTQSNVDDRFRMLVPIYLEMADGHVMFLGRARLNGNTTLEQKVPLKGVKDKPRRAMVNYYDDVLASAN